MLRLEPRPAPSRAWTWASPLLALAITVVIGVASSGRQSSCRRPWSGAMPRWSRSGRG